MLSHEESIDSSALFSRKNKYRKPSDLIDKSDVPIVVGVLVRVSSTMQLDGDSLEMQEGMAIEHIQSINGVLYKLYKEEAISASKTRIENRDKLQELMQDIEDGKVNYVIAYKRDRLFRNSIEHMQFLQFLVEHDCDIYFSARGETQLDLNAYRAAGVAKLMENFLSTMAEMESAQTSARVSDTMISKALRGDVVVSRIPIGYKREGEMFVPIEEFREMKEKIESLYLSGLGIKTIASWLNGKKVKGLEQLPNQYPKPSTHTINPDWNQRNITTILFSPFYTGHTSLNSKKNLEMDMIIEKSPYIIPFRTIAVQKKINDFREKKSSLKKAPRAYNTPFILTGIIHCAICGRPLKTQTSQQSNGTRYSYYKCSHSYKETSTKCSMTRQFKKEIIEKMVLEIAKVKLKEFLNNETYLTFNNKLEGDVKSKESHVDSVSNKIKELNNKVSQYANMIIEIEDFDLKQVYLAEQKKTLVELNELKETHSKLLESIDDAEDEQDKFDKFIEMAKQFSDIIDSASIGIQKQLLENLFSSISVDSKGDIRLEMKVGNMSKLHGKDFNKPLQQKVSDKVPAFISLETIRDMRVSKDIKDNSIGFEVIQSSQYVFTFNYYQAVTDLFKSVSPLFLPFILSKDEKLDVRNSHKLSDEDVKGFDLKPHTSNPEYSRYIYYVSNKLQLDHSTRGKIFNHGHLPAVSKMSKILKLLGCEINDFINYVKDNTEIGFFTDEYMLYDLETVLKSVGVKNEKLFDKLIICAKCKSRYTIKQFVKNKYYRCTNDRWFKDDNKIRCVTQPIPESVLIDEVKKDLKVEDVDRRFLLENIKEIIAYPNGGFDITYK